jgi:hypothetical protein
MNDTLKEDQQMEGTLKKKEDIHKTENRVKWMEENNMKNNSIIFSLEVVRFKTLLAVNGTETGNEV